MLHIAGSRCGKVADHDEPYSPGLGEQRELPPHRSQLFAQLERRRGRRREEQRQKTDGANRTYRMHKKSVTVHWTVTLCLAIGTAGFEPATP